MRVHKMRKNEHRVQTSNPVILQKKQEIVCSYSKCGKSFSEPIELTLIQADGSPETYYACPHCFSRVSLEDRKIERKEKSSDKSKKSPSEALPSVSKKDLEEDASGVEKVKPAGCVHFLGYLRTRPKGTPIPDECLTCAAIMDCM